jgi:hypothetical protein
VPPEEPGFIGTPPLEQSIADKAELDIVSYNILSLELTKGDYYRHLDGTVKIDDHEKRVWLLNKRVEKWMVECKVILLQEATYSFIMKHDFKRGQNLNKHLHDLMQRYGYECYYNFYNYVPARDQTTGKIVPGNGTCTLGLATLVPARLWRVVQSKLLRPWVHSEYTAEDLQTLDRITAEIERQQQNDPSYVSIATLESLHAEKDAVHHRYRNNTPTYADRTVLMLVLESRSNPERRCVIGNIHMPCQYRDPKIMVRIAVKTKKSILDWMEATKLSCPLVLGGDFNSDPNEGSGAYRCFSGAMESNDCLVDENKYVSADEFATCVTDEKWTDLIGDHAQGVCTNYGFTKRNYEESLRKFKDFLEGLAFSASVLAEPVLQLHSTESILRSTDNSTLAITDRTRLTDIVHRARKERGQFFKPRVLVLDHFFLRDKENAMEKVISRRTFIYEIVGRTKGHPIPDLHSVKEPSDHLPIFLTMKWKE